MSEMMTSHEEGFLKELVTPDTSSQPSRTGKEIQKQHYINKINYANFQSLSLTALFEHKTYQRSFRLEGTPSPCLNNHLEMTWNNGKPQEEDLSSFSCRKILIPDGEQFLVLEDPEYSLTDKGMELPLPEKARTLNNRRCRRYPGQNVSVLLLQNSTSFEGTLVDFSPEGFHVRLDNQSNSRYHWLNTDESLNLILKNDSRIHFSGECSIRSLRDGDSWQDCVAIPLYQRIKRFKAKKFRGERYELSSPVYFSFVNPLSGEKHQLLIQDLSGSGFSIREEEKKSVLIPGQILPEGFLILPGGKEIACTAQVIYRDKIDEDVREKILCGLAVLDMDPAEHTLLLNFIHQENDSHAFVSRSVDMNALWNFFFESGFIYPEKYKYILANKEKIKALYEKLYTRHPGIARHFIYQEGSHIQGHMSMLRSYENTWLLHHHAASTVHSQNAGLHVLNQVGSFGNNCHRIHSLHFNYLMCYYQGSNRFPRRVFGDLANKIGDPKSCSLDDFAYFHITRELDIVAANSRSWTLKPATTGEIRDLNSFYQKRSPGLMMHALNLRDGNTKNPDLMAEYEKSGFQRGIEYYSLKKKGVLCAVIMVDQSEAGLNMSDLTNSFKVFLIEPAELTREVIENALAELSSAYGDADRIPVLMYPHDQSADLGFPVEKIYTLWVLTMDASDKYFRYLKTLLRIVSH